MICFFCGNSINTDVCPLCKREQPVLSGGDGYFNIVKALQNSENAVTMASEDINTKVDNTESSVNIAQKDLSDAKKKNANQMVIIDSQDKKIKKLEEKNQLYARITTGLLIAFIVFALLFIAFIIWSRISASRLNEENNSLKNEVTAAAIERDNLKTTTATMEAIVDNKEEKHFESDTPDIDGIESSDIKEDEQDYLDAEATRAAETAQEAIEGVQLTKAAEATNAAAEEEKKKTESKPKDKSESKPKKTTDTSQGDNGKTETGEGDGNVTQTDNSQVDTSQSDNNQTTTPTEVQNQSE